MRTLIDTERELTADAAAVWQIWTDVDRAPSWDPHEERSHLITNFTVGGRAYTKPAGAPGGEFTLTEVIPGERWVARSGLPLGTMTSIHELRLRADGRYTAAITTTATGLGAMLVELGWGRRMRADAERTLAALDERAAAAMS